MKLPRYDSTTGCPKCGGRDVDDRFHRHDGGGPYSCGYGSFSEHDGPHIHRSCRHCGYDWCELPLDASADEAL